VGLYETMERRFDALENPNVPLSDGITTWLDVFGGGGQTAAGVRVNQAKALNLSAVWAATNVIASAVGSLPLKLYQKNASGVIGEVRQHPLWGVLHDAPNPEMTAIAYREAGTGHQLLRGNKYAEIIRDGRGRVVELWLIPPTAVEPRRDRDGTLFYLVTGGDVEESVPADRMLNVPAMGGDGIVGWSVLQHARESFALGLATEEYGSRFFSNGSRPAGILSHPESLSVDAGKRLKAQWDAAQGGNANSHRVAVLEEGVEWQQIGLSAEDSQMLDTREFQVREVARWFRIAPHKIGDLSDASFSNIEEQNIDFMQDTLDPWLVRDEQAMTTRLLTDAERADGMYVEYVRAGRLRGDVEKRGAFYMTRMQTGSITPNEIRAKENDNPIAGGDRTFIQVNMIPLDAVDDLTVAERAELILAEQGVAVAKPEQRDDRTEKRSHTQRIGLRASFAPLFSDAAARMVRGEIRNVRRAWARDSSQFSAWLDDFYFGEHPEFVRSQFGALFVSYGDAVASAAAAEIDRAAPDVREFSEMYTQSFSDRYSASSRGQLQQIVRESDDIGSAIDLRLAEWDEGAGESKPRAARYAASEPVQLGDGIAKLVFSLAGFAAVWRALGDTCPYCRALNGKRVGGSGAFLSEGEEFQPEGADTPLKPKRNVGHPPAHRGCDCTVVAG